MTSNCLLISRELIQKRSLSDYMICKHCGADVSLSNFLLRKTSPEAVSTGNYTLYNTADVLVQELVNPIGAKFKVILVNHASCSKVDNVINYNTH